MSQIPAPVVGAALLLGAAYAYAKLRNTTPFRAKRKLRSTQKRMEARGCTPGIYRLEGNGFRRFGQSACIEKRAPRSAADNADLLGPTPKLYLVERESNLRRRLAKERKLIIEDKARAAHLNCNRVLW